MIITVIILTALPPKLFRKSSKKIVICLNIGTKSNPKSRSSKKKHFPVSPKITQRNAQLNNELSCINRINITHQLEVAINERSNTMFLKRIIFPLTGALIMLTTFSPVVHAAASLSDIANHWAEKPITSLLAKMVVQGYPDGAFKPDQPISRAEFAKIITKTFGYQSNGQTAIPDAASHWANEYIKAATQSKVMKTFADGSFRPESRMNRAQLATMICRVLHLATPEEQFNEAWPVSFSDVPTSHWAYRYIEIGNKLGLFPRNYQTQYQPDLAVTRAEASWAIQALSQITVTKGKISNIEPDSGLVNIHGDNNEPLLTLITPDTILLRNNVTTSLESLLTGDEATVITAPSGDIKFFKAFGKVTKNDLLSRISSYTKGNLKPTQINALVVGDWESLKNDVKGGLYNKMVETGLTPGEAESIMVQDWNYLDTLSKDRLVEALSGYLGITQEFSQAIISRDLEKIKEYGRIELATAALSKLLGAGGMVAEN
jgi:hypothetical protein